jgi:parallel beta-helix repeat protein
MIFSVLPATANNVIVVPDDYSTIQEAVDHSSSGDTVLLKSGVYHGNVVLDKNSVSLVGENRDTTVIDGSGIGTVVYVNANNAEVSNFTIQNSGDELTDSGIRINGSYNALISNNEIHGNHLGVYLSSSSNCTLRDNSMTENKYNFGVSGSSLQEFIHDIDMSNTVDGKPVAYFINQTDKQPPADAGYVAVINSTNITIKDLTLSKNWQTIMLAYTTDSTIENITVTANMDAIWLIECSNCSVISNCVKENNWGGIALVNSQLCTFEYNNITGNKGYGVFLSDSSDNMFYNNNFIDNLNQVWLFGVSINSWDNREHVGGNYWSDYTGLDNNKDGFGDRSYVIDSDNMDEYPLLKPYSNVPPISNFVQLIITGILIIAIIAIVVAYVLNKRRYT